MTKKEDARIQAILQVGIDLQSIGVSNFALEPNQTLKALDQAEKFADILVLGADVLHLGDDRFEYTGDSWCVPSTSPIVNPQSYRVESFRSARHYIRNYKSSQPIYYKLSLSNFDELSRILEAEDQEKKSEREFLSRNT